MHINSALLFQKYAKHLFKPGMRVLEVGPDNHPSTYRRLVGLESLQWETIDIFEQANLTYVAKNEYSFPVPDNTFDIVVSGQVIEHVRKPWLWVKELSRVCKKGGLVITIAPVNWPYHEAPIDCWRVYPEGLKALYEDAGLAARELKYEALDHSLLKVSWKDLPRGKRVPFKVVLQKILTWPFAYSIFDTIAVGVKEG